MSARPTRPFWDAVERAQQRLASRVPIQAVGIVQPPYEYEDRLRPLPIRGLKRLQILVPEAHDLALMKVARGEAHDLEAIEEIHRISPFSLATLVSLRGVEAPVRRAPGEPQAQLPSVEGE